jgi:hypothetical protein
MPEYNISTHRANSAATTNATSVKGTGVRLVGGVFSNVNAAARYLKLYDKASAPVVGTDVPVLVVPIPPTGLATLPLTQLAGLDFALGLAYAITGAAADADATAVAAGDVKVNLSYY